MKPILLWATWYKQKFLGHLINVMNKDQIWVPAGLFVYLLIHAHHLRWRVPVWKTNAPLRIVFKA